MTIPQGQEQIFKAVEDIRRAVTQLTEYLHSNGSVTQALEDEVCGMLGYAVESGPLIPAGWEVFSEGGINEDCYWSFPNSIRWRRNGKSDIHSVHNRNIIFIRQTINIDLSKQPKELVAFAMDEDRSWNSYDSIPYLVLRGNWGNKDGTSNYLYPSQHPDYSGSPENSLLVRPEAMNKPTNESEK